MIDRIRALVSWLISVLRRPGPRRNCWTVEEVRA